MTLRNSELSTLWATVIVGLIFTPHLIFYLTNLLIQPLDSSLSIGFLGYVVNCVADDSFDGELVNLGFLGHRDELLSWIVRLVIWIQAKFLNDIFEILVVTVVFQRDELVLMPFIRDVEEVL